MYTLVRIAIGTVVFATLPGCAGNELGALGEVLGGVLNPAGAGGAQQAQARVEIQGVNASQRSIQVTTDQGETGTVLYDQSTVVVYQQQQYPPTALERGDIAIMQLQRIDQGIYVSRIDVEQSVQERGGQTASGQLREMYGRVGQVDLRRGFFDLQAQDRTYTVFVSSGAGAANVEFFNRLRTGDTVRIEGRVTDVGRVELYRFM